MGGYMSRADQTTWSVNVSLKREGAEITYTLSSTTESLVKVIKGSGGSTITMIVNPLTGEMTLDDKSTGKDGDLTELTTILKEDLMASIAKRWNLVVEEEEDSDDGSSGSSGTSSEESTAVEEETKVEEPEATEVAEDEVESLPVGSAVAQIEEDETSDGWDSE